MGHGKGITRRDFLKSTAWLAAGTLSLRSLAQTAMTGGTGSSRRLPDGWEFHHGSLGGPWDVWRTDKSSNIRWQPVQVPHCFNARDAVDPDEDYYQGPAWYRTRIKLSNPFPNGRTLLQFEGVGQKSDVFVYLDRAGQHTGGYDEFVVDITESAARAINRPEMKGEVPIAVLCDNSRDLEMIPSSMNDFPRYGGIYRHVNLIYVPAISLERVHIDAAIRPGHPPRISVKGRLYNSGSFREEVQLVVRIFNPGGSLVHSSSLHLPVWDGERELSAVDVPVPEYWSPSRPALYRCEVALTTAHGSMTVSERFGIRYFEFLTHGPFKLNGERLVLRGTQREEDHAGVGAAMTDDLIRAEMKLIKEMGANFIRLGHYQQSRLVLELCDELGLLVWEEIPWGRGGLGGERYQHQASAMLRSMIDQHYNHPSVIIWGLGNESDQPGDFPDYSKDKIRAFVKELNDQAHALDPGRKTAFRRCDFCKDLVDVYSPSIWAGWYHGRYTEYKKSLEKAAEQVDHLLHVEWGGDSHARRHFEDPDRFLARVISGDSNDSRGLDFLLNSGQDNAPVAGDWSETYACNLFDWHLKEQETMPWLTGSAQWIFKDFASPLRFDNPLPKMNEKGLVERDLTLKEGYYVFQSYWTETPMVHIYGHSWPVRWGDPDETKLVKVYSNCETVELFLNDASCGVKKRNSQDFPAAGLHWLLKFKAGENKLRAAGQKHGRPVVDEVRFQYQTEKWGKPAKLELRKKSSTKDVVILEAQLFDSNHIACLDARNIVRFGLTGDGKFLDDLGTTTGSRVLELYNGRAEVRMQLNLGKSVVSVSSAGLPTTFLNLDQDEVKS